MNSFYWVLKKKLDKDIVEIDKEALKKEIEANYKGKIVEGIIMPDHVFLEGDQIIFVFSGNLIDKEIGRDEPDAEEDEGLDSRLTI
mgnify:CR=1 FL=1